MNVYILTKDRGGLGARGFKLGMALKAVTLDELKTYIPNSGDITYLDISGLDEAQQGKMLSLCKKRCQGHAWGIVDPDGSIADPASVFFSGASDYIGPSMCARGLTRARVKAAIAYAETRQDQDASTLTESSTVKAIAESVSDATFGGWKSIQIGSVYPFCFLLVTVSAQMNLRIRLGESGYRTFRDRLRQQVQAALADSDPLLWMETEANALYLLPPCASRVSAASEACLRMILGAPLIGYERLGLPFPISFSFAMHYGETEFASPGKTGTIVSDSVNYIHHLGSKKTEPGRLTVSEEAMALVARNGCKDLFVPAGIFEGRTVSHSRRFV